MLCVQQVLARLCKIQMRDSMPPPAQVGGGGQGEARSHELKKTRGESTVKKDCAISVAPTHCLKNASKGSRSGHRVTAVQCCVQLPGKLPRWSVQFTTKNARDLLAR